MKKKIPLLVVAVVALLGSAVLATNHYNKTQIKKQHDDQVVAQAQDDALKVVKKERDEFKALAVANFSECERGRTLYDSLTPVIKKTQTRPSCTSVVQ